MRKKRKEEIVAKAVVTKVDVPPQKTRHVLDLVRGKQVDMALQLLKNSPRKSSRFIEKLIRSAISNAEQHAKADVDKLWVSKIWADMGMGRKKMLPRARGRADILRKRQSRVTVLLGERV